ncbi:unnamed protein product [Rotaria sp. Silwood2]|nr:unnamed protein product [Rotaria sp. Silwood2]
MSNSTRLALPNDFAAKYDAYMNSNYLRVTITCGSRYVTINRQEAKLTIVDTFAAIGGQTGLWIGLSVLSFIEFCELIYWMAMKRIFLWRSLRQVKTNSEIGLENY